MEFGLYKDYTSRTHGDVKIMGMIKYTSQQDLPSDLQNLIEEAKRGFEQSYAPYSRYRVGSAIKDSTGRIYIGGNQENASYPLCMCAERVALYAYSTERSKGPIKMLAVYTHSLESQADEPASPCGACRQVISEFQNRQAEAFQIAISNQFGHTWVFDSILDLLPHSFNPENLLGQ